MSLQQYSLTRRDTRGYQNIYTKILDHTLQQNVFIATNFSEEIFFVTENLHLATKYIIRH